MDKRSIRAVLLIEDNAGDARLLREMLNEYEARDIELSHVDCISAARAHLRANAVDIILLDLGLPDAQGLEGVRQLHAAAPHTSLVVLTGLDDESLALRALQQGAQDFLVKGQIETSGLLRALRYAVERKFMDEALFAEKERAEVTLNSIGDAVACSDIAGDITYLNRVAETLTGWTFREAAGRPMTEVFRIIDATSHGPIADPFELVVRRDRGGTCHRIAPWSGVTGITLRSRTPSLLSTIARARSPAPSSSCGT